mmetsp:Transcript_68218/g.163702  ORF Transcript_68218/g.163702 Transcript_68218/m.163702 type:complete len:309 (-) Transcript_68218:1221-2147(-)
MRRPLPFPQRKHCTEARWPPRMTLLRKQLLQLQRQQQTLRCSLRCWSRLEDPFSKLQPAAAKGLTRLRWQRPRSQSRSTRLSSMTSLHPLEEKWLCSRRQLSKAPQERLRLVQLSSSCSQYSSRCMRREMVWLECPWQSRHPRAILLRCRVHRQPRQKVSPKWMTSRALVRSIFCHRQLRKIRCRSCRRWSKRFRIGLACWSRRIPSSCSTSPAYITWMGKQVTRLIRWHQQHRVLAFQLLSLHRASSLTVNSALRRATWARNLSPPQCQPYSMLHQQQRRAANRRVSLVEALSSTSPLEGMGRLLRG